MPTAHTGPEVGRLAVATDSNVHTLDTANPATRSTLGFPAPGTYRDLEFGPSGTAYVIDQIARQVLSIALDGDASSVETTFGGGAEPVAIAVDEPNDRIFVLENSNDDLVLVDRTDADKSSNRTLLGQFDIATGGGLVWEGVRHLLMVTAGSSIVRAITLPAFDLQSPLLVTGTDVSWGGFAWDRENDLIALANRSTTSNSVIRVRRDTGETETIAEGVGAANERLLSVTYHLASNSVYVGTDGGAGGSVARGKVYRIDLATNAVSQLGDLLLDTSGAVVGLSAGPPGFTMGAGKLVFVTAEGGIGEMTFGGLNTVYYQNPGGGNQYAGLAFTSDGTGIVVDYGSDELLELDKATGIPEIAPLATGLAKPEGIAVDPGSDDFVYVANQGTMEILRVRVSDGSAVALAVNPVPVFNLGAEPSPIAVDALGSVLFGEGNASLTVRRVDLP